MYSTGEVSSLLSPVTSLKLPIIPRLLTEEKIYEKTTGRSTLLHLRDIQKKHCRSADHTEASVQFLRRTVVKTETILMRQTKNSGWYLPFGGSPPTKSFRLSRLNGVIFAWCLECRSLAVGGDSKCGIKLGGASLTVLLLLSWCIRESEPCCGLESSFFALTFSGEILLWFLFSSDGFLVISWSFFISLSSSWRGVWPSFLAEDMMEGSKTKHFAAMRYLLW